MPFVSFSSELVIDSATSISNVFFDEYLPACPSRDSVLVYLYGLYLCGESARYDNTMEHIANTLKLTQNDVFDAYKYWQERGLVTVISSDPLEVKYLPVKSDTASRKYESAKYADFNAQIQAVISKRMITPNEYSQYYDFLKDFHVEPAALVMTAKYCADIKGQDVGYVYILTVARNWAGSGIKTVAAVDEKLKQEAEAKTKSKRRTKDVKVTKHSYEAGEIDSLFSNDKLEEEFK